MQKVREMNRLLLNHSSRIRALQSSNHIDRVEIFVLHIFLAGDLLLSSKFYEFVGFWIRTGIFYATVICIFVFATKIFLQFFVAEIIVLLAGIALMLVQILHFGIIARDPTNFNSIGQYYTMFSFVIFSVIIGRHDRDSVGISEVMKVMFLYSCLYVSLYVVASVLLNINFLPEALVSRITQTDRERGARILIVSSPTLFCFYYAYFEYFLTKNKTYLIMIALSLAALFISQSRLLIAIVFFVWIASTILPSRRAISVFSFLIFLVISSVLLFGMVDTRWNPFSVFGQDTSAIVRTNAYESVRQILLLHPFLGAGIAASDPDMVHFTANPTLSPADLGPIGIWFVFGLTGLVIYVASVYVQCFCTRLGGCGTVAHSKTIQYTGCIIGLFGCLTPTWFNGSLVGLFYALYFRRGSISHNSAHPLTAPSRGIHLF